MQPNFFPVAVGVHIVVNLSLLINYTGGFFLGIIIQVAKYCLFIEDNSKGLARKNRQEKKSICHVRQLMHCV